MCYKEWQKRKLLTKIPISVKFFLFSFVIRSGLIVILCEHRSQRIGQFSVTSCSQRRKGMKKQRISLSSCVKEWQKRKLLTKIPISVKFFLFSFVIRSGLRSGLRPLVRNNRRTCNVRERTVRKYIKCNATLVSLIESNFQWNFRQ